MATQLAAYRKAAGFETQVQLSEALGVDRGTVGKWEVGERYPRPPMISRLAKTLNVSERKIIEAITSAKSGIN